MHPILLEAGPVTIYTYGVLLAAAYLLGVPVQPFQALLGVAVEHVEEVPTERVKTAFFSVGDTHLELLEPTDPDSVIGQFIAKRAKGSGSIHHLCFEVDDLDAVLGAVAVREQRAPVLVTRDMLRLMKPRTVVVDLSIDMGGCFETSRPSSVRRPRSQVSAPAMRASTVDLPAPLGPTSPKTSPGRTVSVTRFSRSRRSLAIFSSRR